MTIEGAPAVGKSTTAAALEGHVVPEVNKLFGKWAGNSTGQLWYLQRQLERWQMARQAQASGQTAILDGDIFQPIWFSALFWHEDWGDFEETVRFFELAVQEDLADLPDRFVILTLSAEARTTRALARCLKAGRPSDHALAKVAKYAAFATFQSRLFERLDREFQGLVAFVDTASLPCETAARIRALPLRPHYQAMEVVRSMAAWCREYRGRRGESTASAVQSSNADFHARR